MVSDVIFGGYIIKSNNMNILITGSAGFIGSHLIKHLFSEMEEGVIIGLDNLNAYYDTKLKKYRLEEIEKISKKFPKIKYKFIKGSINDQLLLSRIFFLYKFDVVVHLAAQAGVRYSMVHPDVYIESNIVGFHNILDICYRSNVQHFIYASSSSVYGNNRIPFRPDDPTDKPISLYAVTKKCDELFAYYFSKTKKVNTTGLRFFTVYGPSGRPDMFYYDFVNTMIKEETIEINNRGYCFRDFTYIDDAVECIIKVIKQTPKTSYNIYNISGGKIILLKDFIDVIQKELIKTGLVSPNFDFDLYKQNVPTISGDMMITEGDISLTKQVFEYEPKISIEEGIHRFIEWYKQYHC